MAIEKDVTSRFGKQIAAAKARLEAAFKLPPGPGRLDAVKQGQVRMRALEGKREQERTRALEAAGIRMPPIDREPKLEPRKTAADTVAEGDPRKARILLRNQILDELRAEPPRRTVTGSFRVH